MEQSLSNPNQALDAITVQCPSCNKAYRLRTASIKSYPAHATCNQCKTRIRIEAPEPLEPSATIEADNAPPLEQRNQPAATPQPLPPQPHTSTEADAMPVFIGRNVSHYLKKFTSFQHATNPGFSATWHWPAFFFTPLWFLYRKLYGWALLSFITALIPFLNWLFRVGWAISANYLYYKHVQKKITDIKQGNPHLSDTQMDLLLQKKGGVHSWVWGAAALPLIGIIAAIAIPQFAAYRNRSYDQSARVAVQRVMEAQHTYHSQNGRFADSIDLLQEHLQAGGIAPSLEVVITSAGVDDYSVEGFHPNGTHRFTASADSSSPLELPIASHDLFGPNKWCKITLPQDWQAMQELNADADIQAGNRRQDAYLIVFVEDKTDFFGVDLESFAELTRTGIEDFLLSTQTTPTDLDHIGRYKAIQHKITGSVPDTRVKVVYLHTVVQGQRAYYQILAWTTAENYAANQQLLQSVSSQLTEL